MPVPHSLTPEWAVEQMEKVCQYDDPDLLDAVLGLLASVAATQEQDKFKHEMAMFAMEYGYRKTKDCDAACLRYLGVAV